MDDSCECGHKKENHYPDRMCSHLDCDCLCYVVDRLWSDKDRLSLDLKEFAE